MGLLDSIGRLIKKIISVVFKFIKKIFGKFFLLLLILVIIWFAPYLAGFLRWNRRAGVHRHRF